MLLWWPCKLSTIFKSGHPYCLFDEIWIFIILLHCNDAANKNKTPLKKCSTFGLYQLLIFWKWLKPICHTVIELGTPLEFHIENSLVAHKMRHWVLIILRQTARKLHIDQLIKPVCDFLIRQFRSLVMVSSKFI